MAGQYTLNGNFRLIEETQGTLYNVGISDVELSSDATKGQGILLRSGETQAFKGTIYARSYDESGVVNVQNFIELPGGGDGGGGGGGEVYTLPTMSQAVKGGAKLGAGLSMTGEVLSLDSIYIPSAVVSQTATGAILTLSDHNGTTTASIKSGADGEDGETPTISTDSIEGGNSVTFGTSAGFWTVNIYNGTDGAAGVSPTVAAESIEGGNAVTFTSAAGLTTINIMDGVPGANGIGVTMTTDSIEGGTALKMHSASGFVTVNVYNGKDGAAGADGKSFEIKAQYATEAALIAAHPTGQAGDAYLVGSDNNPDLYIWLSDDAEWQNSGPIAGIVGPQGPKGDDGVSARVAISSIVGGNRVTFTDGAGAQTMDILNGVNGVSPSVSVATITGGHSVTFTDATTTNTVNILDGAAGEDGDSVTFSLESVTGGNRVTLTDANGSSSFTVYNGRDGADGASLTATVDTITGGHVVSITGGSTSTAFNVLDGTDGENGVSPICGFTTLPNGYTLTISDAQGAKSATITNGVDGVDGVSPSCAFTTIPNGYILSITDAEGTESATITNGVNGTNGTNGTDGYSPTATFETISGGNSLTITDKNGAHSVNIYDGIPFSVKRSTAYAVGDVVYVSTLKSYLRAECVTAGTTAATLPAGYATATAGAYVTDGTAVFIIDDIRDGHFVGEVFMDTILRPGCVKANGATASNARENYPRIVKFLTDNPSMNAASAAAQTSAPYKFFYNSAANTIVFPNYTDRFVEGGVAAGAKSAGLPNITGTASVSTVRKAWTEAQLGAFSNSGGWPNARINAVSDNTYNVSDVAMDASRSSSIYGGSTTVQPPAIVEIPQLRY